MFAKITVKKFRTGFFAALMFLAVQTEAQQFPFDCLLVNPNGDVDLYWSLAASNNVEKYYIYYSFDGSVFTLIDSVDDQFVTNYHHANAQADAGSRSYYLEAVINGQSNLLTDTLSTIYLQLDNSDPGYARLYWNALHTPLPGGSSSWYKIYREYPQGDWTIIDSTQNTQYVHWADVCEDSLTFFISIGNGSCNSASNLTGGIFKDIEYPDKPVLDSVSVDNGRVIMGWTASDSADVAGYIIYRFDGVIWQELDTVFGKTNTFFTDSATNACLENREYAIASIDSCGNKSPGTFSTPQRPVFLYPVQFSTCGLEDTLIWEAYINSDPPVEKYEIWANENGGAFYKAGEVDGNTLTFIHQGLSYAVTYGYFVRAVFGDKSSSSCIQYLQTVDYRRPRFVYLTTADVLPDNTVDLEVHVDTTLHTGSWEILRSDDNGGSFNNIHSLFFNELTGFPLAFNDQTADGSQQNYLYRVDVVDSCGKTALQSNECKTVWLSGSLISEQEVNLQWNAFEGWDEGVLKYRIFRMQGETEPAAPFDSVPGNVLTYTDDISSLNIADGRFSYWVQAVQDTGNIYGYRKTANSNRILLQQESRVWFPNAFRPGGVNNVFKPVFSFFGGTGYLFRIYNRWGQLIFETTDPLEGWDGKYNGHLVQRGTYAYFLSYKNVFGGKVEKRGTVTVIY